MSSRLERAASGRPVRAVVTAPDIGLPVGAVFLVLGDSLLVGEDGFVFTGQPTGRPPLPAETPRRNGVGRTGGSRPRSFSEEERARALELVSNGLSWSAVAEEVGCSKGTVGDWVRRAQSVPKRAPSGSSRSPQVGNQADGKCLQKDTSRHLAT